jgi:hypothetical protein
MTTPEKTERTVWYALMEFRNPAAEPFAVLSVDTEGEQEEGGGLPATVVSLHWMREEAERIVREFNEGPLS